MKVMQDSSFKLVQEKLGAIPLIDRFVEKLQLRVHLENTLGSPCYIEPLILLLKNILVDRNALYSIKDWSAPYDPVLVAGRVIGDDRIARALDKLFKSDRATLMTSVVLEAIRQFKIDVSEIHNDTTSLKVHGSYSKQRRSAVQLKRGWSKDHRPDLKQLVYDPAVTRDGCIPIYFKVRDGNRTDDTLYWENWLSIRGLLNRSDFLFVGDSKLCVTETMMNIDREHGRFITMVPRNREQAKQFNNELLASTVRWERLTSKRSSRKSGRMDIIDVAVGPYKLWEGFRLYWYRSSEKRRRDKEDRDERIETAFAKLKVLDESTGRGRPKTKRTMQRRVDKLLHKCRAEKWVQAEISFQRIETFKQKTRGRATDDTDYRRIIKHIPRLTIRRNIEAITRSEVIDGIFPLTTNTDLDALYVLNAYKYQPKLEKLHSLLKSLLLAAPFYLKRNDRIDALMFVNFLAQLIAALIERQLRIGMKEQKVSKINILPEARPSKHPSPESILTLFETETRHVLKNATTGATVQTFREPLSPVQQQVLKLLDIESAIYV